jgi:glyoxylase-like metal-dependent hydrolase (beta-lactamase superfamily II)
MLWPREWDFWTNTPDLSSLRVDYWGAMRLDTAERFLPPISGQIAFRTRVEIVPGITAIAVPGHTPGQLAPVRTSEGEQLLALAGNVLTRRFIQ